MKGYKNAPHIEPQIGDVVECGMPGSTAVVASFGERNPAIVNCAIDGRLHLNAPEEAVLVHTVDARNPDAQRPCSGDRNRLREILNLLQKPGAVTGRLELLVMTISITSTVTIEELAEQVDRDEAEVLILAIDANMADYDFTFDLTKKLVAALKAEHDAVGEVFDIRQLES